MDFLILYRMYAVLSVIFEKLSPFLADPGLPDISDARALQELDVIYILTNGWQVHIREKYSLEAYELYIDYVYLLRDATAGEMILSCDNSPHHARVKTFPHHTHRYPKNRFKPTEFSGRFEDFLEDVLWEMTRR